MQYRWFCTKLAFFFLAELLYQAFNKLLDIISGLRINESEEDNLYCKHLIKQWEIIGYLKKKKKLLIIKKHITEVPIGPTFINTIIKHLHKVQE